eukprot:CAMPEP_0180439714 /NCGR_PEP_ID=MMETSP1036_2-20121128/12731_1 /TAXON_ID=632150 /ORGANISM="Azadinium spinosum, Strain 3D9" /LENGTH=61 /DNA_ID=CAMNT_0022445863 /DNA_START=607 /DNA_END=792 /DNA_ORIENTATION=-
MTALSNNVSPSAVMKAGTFFNGLTFLNSSDCKSGYVTILQSISSVKPFSLVQMRIRAALFE